MGRVRAALHWRAWQVASLLLLAAVAVTAQEPPPPQPISPAAEAAVQRCLDETTTAGAACTLESDTLSLQFPRDSTELPTADQRSKAISEMKSAGQPSQGCCKGITAYIDLRCPCDPNYQQILPIGGFSPNYFIGATSILADACNLKFECS